MSQKALFIPEKLGAWTLSSRPIPKAGAGQLLVKIEVTALNPIDWKIQKHGWFIEQYPTLLGTDIAGVVQEVGAGVTNFAKGDRVVFQGSWTHDEAGYQQYTLATASLTAKIPSKLSFEQAATIPVAAAASVIGLYGKKGDGGALPIPFEKSKRGANAGQPFVLFGGATSVGQFAIQLAKLSGFSPIIAIASSKHETFLKGLGATHIVDRNTPASSLAGEIAKITTKPLNFIFDTVSGDDTQKAAYSLVPKGGQLVVVLPPQSITAEEGRPITHCLGILAMPHAIEIGKDFYSHLTSLIEEGAIQPNRLEVVPGGLSAVAKALDRLENNQVSGIKLVIHPQEGV